MNHTVLAGLLAFTPAALAAAVAGVRATAGRERRAWTAIAVLTAAFALEAVLGLRHRLGLNAAAWLRSGGIYQDRRPVQAAMIAGVGLLALLIGRWLLARSPNRAAAAATAATAGAATLFAAEMVSLHAVDALLYRAFGPIMLVGWLWLACGWTATAAALRR